MRPLGVKSHSYISQPRLEFTFLSLHFRVLSSDSQTVTWCLPVLSLSKLKTISNPCNKNMFYFICLFGWLKIFCVTKTSSHLLLLQQPVIVVRPLNQLHFSFSLLICALNSITRIISKSFVTGFPVCHSSQLRGMFWSLPWNTLFCNFLRPNFNRLIPPTQPLNPSIHIRGNY